MVFTNAGAQQVAWRLGSNLPGMFIGRVAIGDGIPNASVLDSELDSETLRVDITGTPDFSEARKVTFQADFNSVQMSGLQLNEFGLFGSGLPANVGSIWLREQIPPVDFDGTNELQLTTSLEVLTG